MEKYNYVICGSPGFYDVAYHDIKQLTNVRYLSSIYDGVKNGIVKKLIRCTFSQKLNKFTRLPFSKFTFNRIFPFSFKESRPLCVVFFNDYFTLLTPKYFAFLREKYPNVKLVLYLQDIIASRKNYDIETAKKVFDLIISYDKGDCKQYSLHYFPTPFSKVEVVSNDSIPESDVYFCGKAKTRYNEIFAWYHKLTSWGLKCDFNIIGLDEDKRIYGEGITYCNGLSYVENLVHVKKTKCILEIMQTGADGFTPRLWESIMYDKYLLTNNYYLRKSKYGTLEGIKYSGEIGEEFSRCLSTPIMYSYDVKQSLSPRHLLEFIDEKLLQ